MENQKVEKVFRSRISVLLIVIILAAFIKVSIPMFQYKMYDSLYTLGGILVCVIFIFGGMRYIISGDKLYVKMWFIPTGSVNIADIVSIKRTYNPLSSAAASLKRLCIRFNNNVLSPFWLISPNREQEFVEELKTINPNIQVNIPNHKGIWRFWDWDI